MPSKIAPSPQLLPAINEFTGMVAKIIGTGALHEVMDCPQRAEALRQVARATRAGLEMQNALGLAPPVEPRIAPFHERPFAVPHADRFGEALEAAIESPEVRALPRGVGAAWQFVHSTDVLDYVPRPGALAAVYSAG